MKLIGSALSPFATRVMIAARFKGLDLPVEPAAGGSTSPEFRAQNPIGKVPLLFDGTLVLPESDVIVSYLEDRFPAPSLYPGNAAQRANIRLIVRLVDTYCVPSFGPFVQNDPAAIAIAIDRIEKSLSYIDHFRIDGEFASGPAFSAADCALIPFFHAFEALQPAFKTFDLVRRHTRLEAWWSRARISELGTFATKMIDAAVDEFLRAQRNPRPEGS